jgi:hypothetical protein
VILHNVAGGKKKKRKKKKRKEKRKNLEITKFIEVCMYLLYSICVEFCDLIEIAKERRMWPHQPTISDLDTSCA